MPEYSLSNTTSSIANQGADQPPPESTTLQENMARVALLLDQLTKAVVELRERTAKTESQLSDIRPYLDTIKTHVDSFPNALREARRSNLAVQQQLEKFASRVEEVESRSMNVTAKA